MRGLRSFGVLWCPPCSMRTEFVAFDDKCKDVNDAECCSCGYVFGYKVVEVVSSDGAKYDVHRRGVVSKFVADAALSAAAKERDRLLLSSGVRLEDVRRLSGA